jgi:hypothetical protein
VRGTFGLEMAEVCRSGVVCQLRADRVVERRSVALCCGLSYAPLYRRI